MTYLDMRHVNQYQKILEAYKVFNDTILEATDRCCWAPEIMVKLDDEDYARCYYKDGEDFVEPLFNPVREEDDH